MNKLVRYTSIISPDQIKSIEVIFDKESYRVESAKVRGDTPDWLTNHSGTDLTKYTDEVFDLKMPTCQLAEDIVEYQACRGRSNATYADLIVTSRDGRKIVVKGGTLINYLKRDIQIVGTRFVFVENIPLLED